MTVMEKMVETLGEGKRGEWWDIVVDGEKPLFISVKSGPRDMNKDQIVEFARRARICKENNPKARPLIAMCYGKEPLGPIASTLRKEGLDPAEYTLTGRELYETLTSEKGYHKKLMEMIGDEALKALEGNKFVDIIEKKIGAISEEFRAKYGTVDELLSNIF